MTASGDIIAQRYRIEAPIGEGGMGAVFRATHLELGKTVAVKLVRSDDPSEQSLERFLREAKSAASVRHRNVVDVLDFGRDDAKDLGRPYLVMECLRGQSLEARLRATPPPTLAEIVAWTAGALSGLAAIHDAGIVHRDLKPANIFLAEDADGIVPKVLDFGIARPTQEASQLTHTMQTLGTPHYMSPEQVRSAKTVDIRTDIYSMGVILYLALAGRLPFEGPSATAVIAAIVTDDPVPVSELRPDLPPVLSRLVHRAMARKPEGRFESARAMRDALLGAERDADPGVSADRVSFTTAATQHATEDRAQATPGTTQPEAPRPSARTGRRGFFAMLGVLSTLLVAGLAGTLAVSVGRDGAPAHDSAPAPATTGSVATGTAPTAAAGFAGPAEDREGRRGFGDGLAAAAEPPAPAAPGRVGALAGPGTLAEMALLARPLTAADLASVAVGRRGSDYYLLGPDALRARLSPRANRASAVASTGATASPSGDLTEQFTIELLETTVRANVRTAPREDAPLLATPPARTVVVALADADGSASNDGDGPAFSRVVVADGLEGFIATSLLTAHTGCVPSETAIGSLSTIVSSANVRTEGAERPALLLLDPSGRGVLRVEAVDAACTLTPIARFALPTGRMAEIFVTTTAERGDTLVGIGRWPTAGEPPASGLMSWTVHRLDHPEQTVLVLDLLSGQNLPDRRRDGIIGPVFQDGHFHAVRVRSRGRRTFYDWDGHALVPATTSDAEPATGD